MSPPVWLRLFAAVLELPSLRPSLPNRSPCPSSDGRPGKPEVALREATRLPLLLSRSYLIQGVTLVLRTRVTLARGSLPCEGAKLTVAAEGDIDPPSGAAVMDAGGQFVTPRQFDAHSTSGAARHQAQRRTWTAANGNQTRGRRRRRLSSPMPSGPRTRLSNGQSLVVLRPYKSFRVQAT